MLGLLSSGLGCEDPYYPPRPCPEDSQYVWYCDPYHANCCREPCGGVGRTPYCHLPSPQITCVFPHGVSGAEAIYAIRCIDGGVHTLAWPEDGRMTVDMTAASTDAAPADAAVDSFATNDARDAAPDSRQDLRPDAAPDAGKDSGSADGAVDAGIHDLRPGGSG